MVMQLIRAVFESRQDRFKQAACQIEGCHCHCHRRRHSSSSGGSRRHADVSHRPVSDIPRVVCILYLVYDDDRVGGKVRIAGDLSEEKTFGEEKDAGRPPPGRVEPHLSPSKQNIVSSGHVCRYMCTNVLYRCMSMSACVISFQPELSDPWSPGMQKIRQQAKKKKAKKYVRGGWVAGSMADYAIHYFAQRF